ncbi:hypothetical protein RFI_34598, partial [Reticulomyxa filosa]
MKSLRKKGVFTFDFDSKEDKFIKFVNYHKAICSNENEHGKLNFNGCSIGIFLKLNILFAKNKTWRRFSQRFIYLWCIHAHLKKSFFQKWHFNQNDVTMDHLITDNKIENLMIIIKSMKSYVFVDSIDLSKQNKTTCKESEHAVNSTLKNLVTELQKYEIIIVRSPSLKGKIQADYDGDFNQ